jgi:transposase/Zn finger protein HypA/HybF involved in hydrogenase expression
MVQIDAEKAKQLWNARVHGQTSFEAVFCKDSPYKNIEIIKEFLLKHSTTQGCERCGIASWLDKPITLQLDHISGDHRDHSLTNLRFLCPNCHSQTETFCRGLSSPKNRIKALPYIDKELFLKELMTHRNIRQTLMALNLQPHGANYSRAYELAKEAGILLEGMPLTLKKPTTEVLTETIKELKCTAKMAKHFGVSRQTVQKWLKDEGIPHTRNYLDSLALKEGKPTLCPLPTMDVILSTLQKTGSVSVCSSHLGISIKKLRRILIENKDTWVPLKKELAASRSIRKVPRPTKGELEHLLSIGTSFLSLGKKFGVSDNAVRKWAKSYDIPLKKPFTT